MLQFFLDSGVVVVPGTFTVTGTSTTAFVGAETGAGSFAVTGDTTTAFVAAATAAGTFSVTAQSTLAFVAAATAAGVFSVTGHTTTAFFATSVSGGQFVAYWNGQSTLAFAAQGTGTCTASATGASSLAFSAVGLVPTIAGTFAATGNSAGSFAAVGTVTGTFAVTGSTQTSFTLVVVVPPVAAVPTAPCSPTQFPRLVQGAPDWQHDFQPGTYAIARHRDEMPCYSRDAFGDIYPCRFVALQFPGQVRQAKVGDVLYGISQEQSRGSPYRERLGVVDQRAAADGEAVFVYGPYAADVCLALGGPVKIGQRLTTDYLGRGIVGHSGDCILAVAEEPGNAGDTKKVNLVSPQRMP